MTGRFVSNRIGQLKVRQLGLLDLIHTLGSLSGVAQRLCVTQPAVTGMLQELEAAFETKLVERDRQGARLTPAGLEARARLRLVVNTLSGLETEMLRTPTKQHLRVGVLTNSMLELVPKAVAALRLQGLEVSFLFVESTVEAVITGVLDGSLDCAIGRIGSGVLQSAEQRRLEISEIKRDPLTVVAAPGHSLLASKRVLLRELREHDWVLLPHGTQSRLAFDQAFIQQGLIPPLPIAESLSFYSNFHIVYRTNLLTTVPASTLGYLAADNLVQRVRYRWPIALSPLMFFCLRATSDLPAIAAFKQAILATEEIL